MSTFRKRRKATHNKMKEAVRIRRSLPSHYEVWCYADASSPRLILSTPLDVERLKGGLFQIIIGTPFSNPSYPAIEENK